MDWFAFQLVVYAALLGPIPAFIANKKERKVVCIRKTRRMLVMLFVFVSIPALAVVSFADADGFRGIKWGTELSAVQDMTQIGTDPSYGGVKKYSKKSDELKIGGADLESIEYNFWQDKLFSVTINFKGSSNFSSLKDATFEKFGKGSKPNRFMETYIWDGDITGMMLQYKEILREGHFYMFSKEINKQQKLYQAEKAKKGAETGF